MRVGERIQATPGRIEEGIIIIIIHGICETSSLWLKALDDAKRLNTYMYIEIKNINNNNNTTHKSAEMKNLSVGFKTPPNHTHTHTHTHTRARAHTHTHTHNDTPPPPSPVVSTLQLLNAQKLRKYVMSYY